MSIYIKDMKMPTGCLSCDFCNLFGLYDERYCRRLMRTTPGVTRLNNCPLIGVPDGHGRLIDADAFISRLEHCEEIVSMLRVSIDIKEIYLSLIGEMKEEIENVPTIIPADKEGT